MMHAATILSIAQTNNSYRQCYYYYMYAYRRRLDNLLFIY